MKSHERIKLALQHREADRIPIQDWPWKVTIDRWRIEGLTSGVSPADYFGYELAAFSADTTPQFPIEVLSENKEYIIERDSYGAIRKNHRDHSTTWMILDYPCKSKKDWEKIKPRLKPNDYRVDWVSTLQTFNHENSRGKFLIYWSAVGYDKIAGFGSYLSQECLLKAIIREPDWITDMYQTDAELVMEMCEIMIKGGFRFDAAFLGCDLGYKNGLHFSPKHYEEQLHPVFKELCRYFHSKGMPVMLHSDGKINDLIPYFIEEGIDCLEPLEVKAGMDFIQLKEKYGDKISFMGGYRRKTDGSG